MFTIASWVFGKLFSAKMLAVIMGIGISSTPVGFVAVGLAAIFYTVLLDFIKNKRWIGIAAYLKETYAPAYWSELSGGEKWTHVIRCVFFYAPKLLLGLAVSAVVTGASLGLFHNSSVNLLKMFTCPGGVASTIAWVPTALNVLMTTSF